MQTKSGRKGGIIRLEEIDKAIEIMKAAMEKEKAMKEKAKEVQINEETGQETQNTDPIEDLASEETTETCDAADKQEEADTVDEDEKPSKAGKGFFRNSKSKELAAKDQKIEELTDRLMRTMAEFDNFRKRTEKEKAMMFDMGVRSVIEKILPVVDSFERGLGAINEEEKSSAFAQGIELIYRQMLTTLDDIGLKPIDAVGKDFDPNLHHAVMHGEDENLGENVVSDEFQKGYIYRDMVVRHSMVKVVN